MPGHEHLAIRMSCASSFPEAIEHHPELLSPLLTSLKELYRTKVSVAQIG
jgi:hypothetical protein